MVVKPWWRNDGCGLQASTRVGVRLRGGCVGNHGRQLGQPWWLLTPAWLVAPCQQVLWREATSALRKAKHRIHPAGDLRSLWEVAER